MKKIYSALAGALLLASAGCTVDTTIPTPATGIVGNWILESVGGQMLPVAVNSNTELSSGRLQVDAQGDVLELDNWRDTRPGGVVTTVPLNAHWTASGAGYTFNYTDGRVVQVDLAGSTLTLHSSGSASGDQVYARL